MVLNPVFTMLDGQPLELVLYKSDSCFFCGFVIERIKGLNFEIPNKDIHQDPQARRELVEKGGKSQVPCLFINGKPLYESQDIVHFLETQVLLAQA